MTRRSPPLGVLIVEDEALLAMDLEAMVLDAGHIVVGEAASLYDVALLASTLSPAIAFVDVQLARATSGFDAARLIAKRWPDTIIVFVTANPPKLPLDFAGAHGVIAKPFSRTGLTSAMQYIAVSLMDRRPDTPLPPSFTASGAFASACAEAQDR